jgi:hypothetical protein
LNELTLDWHSHGTNHGIHEAMAANGIPADDLARMCLSSRTVHADDHISAHRAVAPAMHVSTTFRYSDHPTELERSGDPTKIIDWTNTDVSDQAPSLNVGCSRSFGDSPQPVQQSYTNNSL